MSQTTPAELLGTRLTDKGHCCQEQTDWQNTLRRLTEKGAVGTITDNSLITLQSV